MTDLCIRNHFELAAEHVDGETAWCEIQQAEAKYGLLCGKCYGRTRHLMSQTPQLIAHIRSQVAPAMQSARGERIAGTRELPIPLNPTAVEDSHDLYAQLVNWFTNHARSLGIRPAATILEAYRKDTDATQLPFWANQQDAHDLVDDLNRWYLRNQLAIAGLRSSGAFHDDLVDVVKALLKRYPDARRRSSGMRPRMCPFCGEEQLRAEWVGSTSWEIECKCSYCGYVIPDEYLNQFIDWSEW